MKICKKILAGILVFAMMMSMCAFVSADETETTPVTNRLLWKNNFEERTVGDTMAGSANWNNSPDTTAASSKPFYTKGGSPSNKAATTTVVGDDTNKYITTTHNRLGYNPYLNDADFKTLGHSNELSVLSTSYDIMIPANDPYKANRRYAYVNVGTYTAGSYDATIVTPTVSIVNGKIIGSCANTTTLYSKELDYTYGEWVTLRIDAWINDSNKISVAVYADDRLVFVADYVGSRTAVGLGSRFIEFLYANIENGATATAAAATTGIESYTNYDNIEVSLLTADNEVTTEDIDAQKAFDEAEEQAKVEAEAAAKAQTPYIRFIDYTGAEIGSTAGTVKAATVFPNTGTMDKDLVQGGDTHVLEAAYEVIDGNYTNVTSTSFKYLVGVYYESFADYIPKTIGSKSILVNSWDVNPINFNAKISGSLGMGLDLHGNSFKAPDGTTMDARKTNDIAVAFSIGTDGNINFVDTVVNSGFGAIVPDKVRSESRPVTAGEWSNIKVVYEITHAETQYEIKVWGIFNETVIFENEYTITYTDYDKDGKSDDINFSMMTMHIGTKTAGTTHDENVIGLRNIYVEKNNNFDWSVIDTDNWSDRTVSLTLDASGNVDVEAKKGGDETFTSGVLVVALYDAKGSLVDKVLTSSDISDGKFVYEVPATKVATAKTIKAFVFDAITTAVPQMKHGEIVIGTN